MSEGDAGTERPLDILFVVRNPVFVRNFEFVLREMAGRGHRVRIAFEARKAGMPSDLRLVEALAAELPTLSFTFLGPIRSARLAAHSSLRSTLDALRYFEPGYAGATKLRARAVRHAPIVLRPVLARLGLERRPAARRRLRALLRRLDRLVPGPRALDRLLATERPDVVLLTPMVHFRSYQPDVVRAARRAGIPSALVVFSWDNLTNKGLLHAHPDRIVAWNAAQRDEAVRLHDARPGDVLALGSPAYDHWFEWEPSRDRATFCAAVGLDPAQPFLLYTCSSQFIAPDEPEYVRRWLAAVRGEPALAETGVLVRPHPMNAAVWGSVQLDDDRTVVHPRAGADPVDVAARQDYFDAIFHSAAVVGINTTALVESAIVGRATLTALDPLYVETQTGTPHFSHLVRSGGGPLTVGADLAEHVGQLARTVHGEEPVDLRGFVERFVRPGGLDRPVAPRVVDAVEDLAGSVRDVPRARSAPLARGLEDPVDPDRRGVGAGGDEGRTGA